MNQFNDPQGSNSSFFQGPEGQSMEVEAPRNFLEDDFTYDITAAEHKAEIFKSRTNPFTSNHFLLHTVITEPQGIIETICERDKQATLNSIIKFINTDVSNDRVQKVWYNPNFKSWSARGFVKTRISMVFIFEKDFSPFTPNQNLEKTLGPVTFNFRFGQYQDKARNKAQAFCATYEAAEEYRLTFPTFMMSKDNDIGSPMLKMELNRMLGGFPKPTQPKEDEEEKGKEEKIKKEKDEKRVTFQCAWRKYELLWTQFHNVSNTLFDARVFLDKMQKREKEFIRDFYSQEGKMKSSLAGQRDKAKAELEELKRIETNLKVLWRQYEFCFAQQ